MTNITIVTSFNEKILKDSAHYMLDTLSKNLEPSVNLVCYHHDCNLDNYSVPSNSNITYKNLHDVTEHIVNIMVQKIILYLTIYN